MKMTYICPKAQCVVLSCADVIQSSPIRMPQVNLNGTKSAASEMSSSSGISFSDKD